MIESDQIANHEIHERMALLRNKHIVAQSNRNSSRQNNAKVEQRVEPPLAADVHVEVDAAVMVQNEVANRVRSLDRVRVAVKGRQIPRIACCDEVSCRLVRPQLELAARTQGQGNTERISMKT